MTGGVVLVGGRSVRMGRDKAALDWYGVPLVVHVCAVVRRGVRGGPVVVVRSKGQHLPSLPSWVTVVEDAEAGVGPMRGLLDGLEAIPNGCEAVFLAGVDVPRLVPGFVRAALDELAASASVDAAIPFVGGFRHPLLAAYRTGVAPHLAERLSRGERRAGQIFAGRLRLVGAEALLAHADLAREDPGLGSVEDVDTPNCLAVAAARPLPDVVVEAPGGTITCRAARLADVSLATGLPLAGLRLAGDRASRGDPLVPLVPGDVVEAT